MCRAGDARLLIDQVHVPRRKLRLELVVGFHALGKMNGDWSNRCVFHLDSSASSRKQKSRHPATYPAGNPASCGYASLPAAAKAVNWDGKTRMLTPPQARDIGADSETIGHYPPATLVPLQLRANSVLDSQSAKPAPMPKSTDIRIADVHTDTERLAYRSPIKFGGRVVTDVVLANVHLTVETRDGRRGTGLGSMPLGNVWAWPSNALAPADTLAAMLAFVTDFAPVVRQYQSYGHPLDITRDLAAQHGPLAAAIQQQLTQAEPMPPLAEMVAASPFEAAIHDAYGKSASRPTPTTCSAPSSPITIWRTTSPPSSRVSISTPTRFASPSQKCRSTTWWEPSIR